MKTSTGPNNTIGTGPVFALCFTSDQHFSTFIRPWIFQEQLEAHHTHRMDDQELKFTISHVECPVQMPKCSIKIFPRSIFLCKFWSQVDQIFQLSTRIVLTHAEKKVVHERLRGEHPKKTFNPQEHHHHNFCHFGTLWGICSASLLHCAAKSAYT